MRTDQDDGTAEAVAPKRLSASSTPAVKIGSGYQDLRRGLLSVAVGLAAYYGARSLGATPTDALLISTLVCAGRAAYVAIRQRRFDAIACFLMVANAVTLAVALCTQSPVAVMFGQHIPGVVFLVFVLGSLAVRKPMTEAIVKWLRPQWFHNHTTTPGRSTEKTSASHRTHMRLTTAIAVAQALHLAAASIVILTLSVDVAKGLLGALALATDIAVLAIVIGGTGRNLRHQKSA